MTKQSLTERVKDKNCISGGTLPIKNGRFDLSNVDIGITPDEVEVERYLTIKIEKVCLPEEDTYCFNVHKK